MKTSQAKDILESSSMVLAETSLVYTFLGSGSPTEYMDNLTKGLTKKTVECDSHFWEFSDKTYIAYCDGNFHALLPLWGK